MSDNKITPFLFEGEAMVRVLDQDGAPWFVAADVCRAIGLGNPTMAVRSLDEDEKGISSTETSSGLQEIIIVSEGGLYTLILRSRGATKPGTVAHRFRKWVTSEVLPTIRRTGSYHSPAIEPIHEGEIILAEDLSTLPISTKVTLVNCYRATWGIQAAQEMSLHLKMPIMPAMALALRQRRFDFGAVQDDRAIVAFRGSTAGSGERAR